ncbi:hypothetical protein CFBP1573P_05883 [Pseudomonas syringae pv. persicae]|nr:hypothetical protein CFBP1573P_05883 [Pseudomonas syringae pv. persicae]
MLRLPCEVRGHRRGLPVNGQGLDRGALEHQRLVCGPFERIEQHPGALLDVSHRGDPVGVLGVGRDDRARPPLAGRARLAWSPGPTPDSGSSRRCCRSRCLGHRRDGRCSVEHQRVVRRLLERIKKASASLLDVSDGGDTVRVLGIRRDYSSSSYSGVSGLSSSGPASACCACWRCCSRCFLRNGGRPASSSSSLSCGPVPSSSSSSWYR